MENDLPESSQRFLSPRPLNLEHNVGSPVRGPRVGKQYQAQIPPPNELQITRSFQNDLSVALPVPITWFHCIDENTDNEPIGNTRTPLPILMGKAWKAIEHKSFVLGLYIFGKNLNLVKKFVKSKRMAEILGYYYGKFYRSKEYQRWSKGRKKKKRQRSSIRGEKIFVGWRKRELLSRLFAHVSEDSRSLLREISMKHEENRVSLEEYVFTLKHIVGIEALMDAIAIGKGKRDLTRTTEDPSRTKNFSSHHSKIPRENVFSSLSSQEIVNFVTGDFRFSKAQSNNLFWEAVWPRLLANGWHSEQPNNYALFSIKRSLVFIVPGVKKFLRKKLIKGMHYFDSVSDVLSKLASDPSLLEYKTEEEKIEKEENLSALEINRCPDGFPNEKFYSHLKPPISNGSGTKFTIVDTSSFYAGSKLVELRSLPIDRTNFSILSDFPNEAEQGSSEESSAATSIQDVRTCFAPVIKSLQLSASSVGKSRSKDSKLNRDGSPPSNSSDTSENMGSQVGLSQHLSSDNCLGQGSTDKDDEDMGCGAIDTSSSEDRSRTMVGLNLPPSPQEFGTDDAFDKRELQAHDDSDTSSKIAPWQTGEWALDNPSGRRQSTRNRPLTTKALEAIAYGFLSSSRKRKNVDTPNNSMSRPSRLARGQAAAGSTVNGTGTDNDAE